LPLQIEIILVLEVERDMFLKEMVDVSKRMAEMVILVVRLYGVADICDLTVSILILMLKS